MTSNMSSGVQAAVAIRAKKERQRKGKKGRLNNVPTNIATKEIRPFPQFPPNTWKAYVQKCTKMIPQGKGAWQDGKKAKITEDKHDNEAAEVHRVKASEAHKRWLSKNKVKDASDGEDDNEPGVYRQASQANVVLYVGLGMVAIGMVITFVGSGEKGFKSTELRLVGPSLIGSGVFFSLLRILFCTCPMCCKKLCKCCMKTSEDDKASLITGRGDIKNGAVKNCHTTKSAATIRSNIPNFISDDDDFYDDQSKSGTTNPDPDSQRTDDEFSTPGPSNYPDITSDIPKLPAIKPLPHKNEPELVLNPSLLDLRNNGR